MSLPHFGLMIPGAVSSSAAYTVEAPFDRAPIATVQTADATCVQQALIVASTLYKHRDAWIPLAERLAILDRAGAIMKSRAEELAVEAAREGGKPLIDSRVEVARAIDSLKICVETMRVDQGDVIPMRTSASSAGRIAFTQVEPIGVVVAISAFNHPLNLIAHQVGPAIAAGCPVIVKPARSTPLSCFRFVAILREAGLPASWCQALVPDSNALATTLATDPRVAFLSFIGSAAVGWKLKSQLAPGARCALEHGGVAPVIVAADADLDTAVPLIAKGGYYHAGQVCVSVQRVFVARAIVDDFVARLAAAAQKMVIGDPTLPATEIGPMISPAEATRVVQWIDEAVAAGARRVCGGKAIGTTMVESTLLVDPPADAKVSTHEVFGPVVCVYTFDHVDEAINRANSLPFAFQAAVFTKNLDTALRAYRRLDASAVMVNDHTAFRVDWMPFAGLKQSGYNVGGIPHTIHDLQIRKMMVLRSGEIG
ncbi:aldehyde dehydrogenase family protein [Nevskia sp.]|uniref:aldehyde dehydrogenase family protein n=1 Tax=Nevskia sp. TaxID=1929292 RepID=UPI0025D8FF07|nr:aldehyde dehydrogenase family protein [Nevskia sp.]